MEFPFHKEHQMYFLSIANLNVLKTLNCVLTFWTCSMFYWLENQKKLRNWVAFEDFKRSFLGSRSFFGESFRW